jgi:DNA invertase Pin-like site-specific DNA recombinase
MATEPLTPGVAYSYIRFSHPDQFRGDSLRRQTEATNEWCRRNNARLDTALTLHDLGKSAFAKPARMADEDGMARVPELADLVNPDRRALAAFLEAIKQRRIPRGAYLVIENLDRLSRDDIVPAVHLVTGILLAGVRVVQLKPAETILTEHSDGYAVMMMVVELYRGHGESANKSNRVGGAWQEKRDRARRGDCQQSTKRMEKDDRFLTRRLPAWCRAEGGKPVAIPERAEVVNRIFELAKHEGHAKIVQRLTAERVAAFGPAGHWTRSYVANILCDRRALGQFQPHKGRRRKRRADGRPIEGYFPAVVTQQAFDDAKDGADERRKKPGRVGSHVNVFAGLIHDAVGGGSYYAATRTEAGRQYRVLVNTEAAEGRRTMLSFPYPTFDRAVLSMLLEVDPRTVLGQDEPDRTASLEAQLSAVRSKTAELEAELLNGNVAALANALRQLETKQADLTKRLDAERRRAAHPLADSWQEAKHLFGGMHQRGKLLSALDAAPDTDDARLRLRSALRRIIDRIDLAVMYRGRDRLAVVELVFAAGERVRTYEILHRPPKGNKSGRSDGRWWARSTRWQGTLARAELQTPDGVAYALRMLAMFNPATDGDGDRTWDDSEPIPAETK